MISISLIQIALPIIILLMIVMFVENRKRALILAIIEITVMFLITMLLNYVIKNWHYSNWIFFINGIFTLITSFFAYFNYDDQKNLSNFKDKLNIKKTSIDLFYLILLIGIFLVIIGINAIYK